MGTSTAPSAATIVDEPGDRPFEGGRWRTYRFKELKHCPMCDDATDGHRMLGRRLDRAQGRDPRRVPGISVSVMRCTSCGLIYPHPLPLPWDLQDHYGVPPDSYWSPEYFRMDPTLYADVINTAGELLGTLKGRTALDGGAGIGKGMLALERAGADVYGIEPSRTFRDHAIARMGIAPDRLVQASLEEAELPAGRFDLVVFNVVLEHVPDPFLCIQRAARWLRPGGVMNIQVPSANWFVHRLANTWYRLRGSEHVADLSPMHEPYHLYEFTPEAFRRAAQRLGLQVERERHYVCRTFMPRWLTPPLRWWMRRTGTGMQLDVWLRKPA